MAADVKRKMVEGTVRLLARKGLNATSFSEVLELTGAPRGSVYHHFPNGKDQLVGSAVDGAGAYLTQALELKAGASAQAVTQHFLNLWRSVLVQSDFQSGCAVLAVAIATDSPELLAHTAAVFRGWRQRLTQLLQQGGLTGEQARAFATTLIASVEGAVVLSRAEQSLDAFDLVSNQMLDQLRRMKAQRPRPSAALKTRKDAP